MKLLVISIFVFLVIMYVYTYKRYKKNKKNNINTVDEFRRKYLKKNVSNENQDANKAGNYITKYNSSIDYIEKDAFLKETSDSQSGR
ncbi:hypothetical protein D5281_02275 [bacterium 1xD42-62]|uniref:Uncharacterized protein n=1 Tax=Parablautia muri TaxID=2320879 RepID=A0A9X5BD14_9FIRM|nr:hypothetical protein [Parablautia muri]